MLRDVAAIATAVSAVVTAVGVFLAVAQLRLTRRQARVAFEDTITREYRDIVRCLPVDALLTEPGMHVKREDWWPHLASFYQYFDLCNEQYFLREQARIGADTWENWRNGMAGNFGRPHFAAAWDHVRDHAKPDFDELRRLAAADFSADPVRSWITRRIGSRVRRYLCV